MICTSVIVKQHSLNWKAYVFEFELEDTKLWCYNQSLNKLFNDLIVIIRLNLRGSFSDPILSSGSSCVKPMLALPDPASNVTSDVVSTSKKECAFCFSVDNRAAKHCHSTVGCLYFHCFHVFPCLAVCTSIVSMFFHVFIMFFTFFTSAKRRGVLRVYDKIFSARSPSGAWGMALERWRWEGALGAKGMCGSTAFGCFQPGQGEIKC